MVKDAPPLVNVVTIVTVLEPVKVSTECIVLTIGCEPCVVVVASFVTVPDVGHGVELPVFGMVTFAVTLVWSSTMCSAPGAVSVRSECIVDVPFNTCVPVSKPLSVISWWLLSVMDPLVPAWSSFVVPLTSVTVRMAAVVAASGDDWNWPAASSRKNVALTVSPFDVNVAHAKPCVDAEYAHDDGTRAGAAVTGNPFAAITPAAPPLPICISEISAKRSTPLADDGPVESLDRQPAKAIVVRQRNETRLRFRDFMARSSSNGRRFNLLEVMHFWEAPARSDLDSR